MKLTFRNILSILSEPRSRAKAQEKAKFSNYEREAEFVQSLEQGKMRKAGHYYRPAGSACGPDRWEMDFWDVSGRPF